METENAVKKGNRGGARAGAGRKPTGRKASKPITLLLGDEEAAILDKVERRADFVREAIRFHAEAKGLK